MLANRQDLHGPLQIPRLKPQASHGVSQLLGFGVAGIRTTRQGAFVVLHGPRRLSDRPQLAQRLKNGYQGVRPGPLALQESRFGFKGGRGRLVPAQPNVKATNGVVQIGPFRPFQFCFGTIVSCQARFVVVDQLAGRSVGRWRRWHNGILCMLLLGELLFVAKAITTTRTRRIVVVFIIQERTRGALHLFEASSAGRCLFPVAVVVQIALVGRRLP